MQDGEGDARPPGHDSDDATHNATPVRNPLAFAHSRCCGARPPARNEVLFETRPVALTVCRALPCPTTSREVLEPDPLDVRPEPTAPPAADGDVGFDFHRLAGVVFCIIGIVLLDLISLRLMALRLNHGLMALRPTATRQRPVEGGA